MAEQISRDVSQLCSQLAALWSRFLDAAVLNPHILSYLALEHHTLRVRAAAAAALASSEALLHNSPDVCLLLLSFSRAVRMLSIAESEDDAFKFSQRRRPTRKYKNTTTWFYNYWHFIFASSFLRSDYSPISFRSVFETA